MAAKRNGQSSPSPVAGASTGDARLPGAKVKKKKQKKTSRGK